MRQFKRYSGLYGPELSFDYFPDPKLTVEDYKNPEIVGYEDSYGFNPGFDY